MKAIFLFILLALTFSACQRINVDMAGTEEPRQPAAEYTVKADLNKAGGSKVETK